MSATSIVIYECLHTIYWLYIRCLYHLRSVLVLTFHDFALCSYVWRLLHALEILRYTRIRCLSKDICQCVCRSQDWNTGPCEFISPALPIVLHLMYETDLHTIYQLASRQGSNSIRRFHRRQPTVVRTTPNQTIRKGYHCSLQHELVLGFGFESCRGQ